MIWSTSSFAFYFIEFYMNLLPIDNLYLLSCMIGLADMLGAGGFMAIIKCSSLKKALIGTFGALSISSVALYVTMMGKTGDDVLSSGFTAALFALVFTVRLCSGVSFAMAYYGTISVTPPVVLSTVFSLTNIACRFFTIFSPVISRVTTNPIIYVAVLGFVAFICSFFLNEDSRDIDLAATKAGKEKDKSDKLT